MAQTHDNSPSAGAEPRGFGEHTRRSSSENAHEQGWWLNEDERRSIPAAQQRRGGTDYDYGSQDFGETPADTRSAQPPAGAQSTSTEAKLQNVREGDRQGTARRKTA